MATSGKQSKSTNKKDDSSGNSGQSDMGTAATETVGQVQETVSETVTGLKDQVMEQASTQLTTRLESAAGSLDMAVKLLRTAGDTVRGQDKTGVADSITGVADRIEGWSTSLREQDIDKLIEETKQVAQKQPMLFVGGAAALGFLGARFFASSARKQEEQATSRSDTSSSDSSTGSDTSGTAVDSMSSMSATTDLPDLPPASASGDYEFDNTNPYPSAEENDAIEASMEAPLGSEEMMVFEEEIIVPDFDDSTTGISGSKPGTEGR